MSASPVIRVLRLSVLSAMVLNLGLLSAGELVADRDSYVFGGNRPGDERTTIPGYDSNFGARALLELKTTVNRPDGFTRKIYLGFDLSKLPKDVSSLSLRLTLREMNPGPGGDKILTPQPIKLHLLKPEARGDDWIEGQGRIGDAIENGASTGSLHWRNAPANTINSGDRFDSRAVIEAGAITLPIILEKNHEILIPLTPAAISSLRSGRHGDRVTFMLSIDEGTDDLLRFHSREASKPSYRPALVW